MIQVRLIDELYMAVDHVLLVGTPESPDAAPATDTP